MRFLSPRPDPEAASAAVVVRFARPTPALPVDIFRALVGVLSCGYFLHLLLQARDFSAPEGLIDHTLSHELFWYTRIGLFQPGMGLVYFQAAFMLAALASWGLVLGYRPKLAAAFLFVVAVSTYRWNYLVIYVDDAIMHLVLFWMMLLPIGRTLRLHEWLRDSRASIERWKTEVVPGAAVHCFLANLALIYLVAGLWKWSSPMWREGSALYAILQMPISLAPGFWGPEHLPLLRVASYLALILEPLLPLAMLLPTNHWLKWLLLAGLFAFHAGIVATLKIPYANLACIAAAVLIARSEIMVWLRGGAQPSRARTSPRPDLAGGLAAAFVVVLTLAMVGEATVPAWRYDSRAEQGAAQPAGHPLHAPGSDHEERMVGFLGTRHNALYVPLWGIGIAQSYRLFDWVDDRNFAVDYAVTEHRENGVERELDPRELFPQSLRDILLQSNLHDITWTRVPRSRAAELKAGLFQRYARRFCDRNPGTGPIEVHATVRRITGSPADPPGERELLMQFTCRDFEAHLGYLRLESGGSAEREPPLLTELR